MGPILFDLSGYNVDIQMAVLQVYSNKKLRTGLLALLLGARTLLRAPGIPTRSSLTSSSNCVLDVYIYILSDYLYILIYIM